MPPFWIYLRVKNFGIWLPLFLLWPLFFLLWILVVPIVFFVGVNAWLGLWSFLGACRGICVEIESKGDRIVLKIL